MEWLCFNHGRSRSKQPNLSKFGEEFGKSGKWRGDESFSAPHLSALASHSDCHNMIAVQKFSSWELLEFQSSRAKMNVETWKWEIPTPPAYSKSPSGPMWTQASRVLKDPDNETAILHGNDSSHRHFRRPETKNGALKTMKSSSIFYRYIYGVARQKFLERLRAWCVDLSGSADWVIPGIAVLIDSFPTWCRTS